MRPILLKIKGLNSFIEEQTIDFAKLMEPGLFGIFGPTGSGKTTILDGITLALYGEIARKSSNFVNSNCKSASVLFEFQISGKETKRYRVEREFKKDPNRDGYKTGKCRISDITGETPIVLADKVKEVNACCIEIIGLKADDFQRTVVLPQGKFSEFLKLDGKNRNEMLERLFRLQPYGDGLARKLKAKSEEIALQRSKLEGQLQSYADISEEKLKEKEEETKVLEHQVKEKEKECKAIVEEHKKGEEIWRLVKEQEKGLEMKRTLAEQADEIARIEDKIAWSQKAEKICPFIESLANAEKEIEKTKVNFAICKEQREKSDQRKQELEAIWQQWKTKRDEELPVLREHLQNVKAALGYQKDYLQVAKNYTAQKALKKENEDKQLGLLHLEQELNKELVDIEEKINELKEKQKAFEIPAKIRSQIQEGAILEQTVSQLAKRLKEEEQTLKKWNEEFQESEQIVKQCRDILFTDEVSKALESNLSDYQNKLYRAKETYYKRKEFEQKEQEKALECKNLEEQKASLEKELASAKGEYTKAKELKEKAETEELAIKLRKRLQEGEACPVCGSKHHEVMEEHAVMGEVLLEIWENYQTLEQRVTELDRSLFQCTSRLANILEELKECQNGKAELSQVPELTIECIEERLSVLPKYQSISGTYGMLLKSRKESEEKAGQVRSEYEKAKEQLTQLLSQVSYPTFQAAAERVKACDQSIEKIQNNMQIGQKRYEEKKKELETRQKQRITMEQNIAVAAENMNMQMEQMKALNEKFEESLKDMESYVITEKGLENRYANYQTSIHQIEQGYHQSEEEKEQETKHFLELHGEYLKINSVLEQLNNRIKEESERVEELLQKEQFATKEACVEALLTKEVYNSGKNEVEQYKRQWAENQGVLAKLTEQLAGRSISEEEWEQLTRQRAEVERELENLKINWSNEMQNYKRMGEAWKKQKELAGKLSEIAHQESLMADLTQLFRGKKFVEYVAYSKLNYISKAASHRLRSISNGNYGLELDSNGHFMVCDYKNGGVKRDAFTLSGGETFLVSLSLSLALSEQVQLKGTAPLELFFLDEGFGTLDDELLEVVLGSLERIQNKHLTVGIISHVEAVKNRVPIKLNVKPSVAGMGGTKVFIEKN